MLPSLRTFLPGLLLVSLGAPTLRAQSAAAAQDAPPVNTNQMLQELRQLGASRTTQLKTQKSKAVQEALAAAANPARAMELWEEAVRATQFQGLSKDAAQFREWKEKEGEALKDHLVQGALHLYFNWLALTLQHSAGVSAKDMLPAVITQAHEAIADQAAMDAFEDTLRKEKEATAKEPLPGTARRVVTSREKDKRQDNETVKRLHDQIVKQPLGNSIYVQWMHLDDVVNDVAPARKRGQQPDPNQPPSTWTPGPADIDGLYNAIILPELRAARDPRAIEYWDAKLRREADVANRSKLAFEIDKFNQSRRPQLMWSRAQEFAWIGQKNRAATEMFNLIKTTPVTPETANWIAELENLLAPPKDTSATVSASAGAGVAPPPLPGAQ